jgi:HEAT repeat protein
VGVTEIGGDEEGLKTAGELFLESFKGEYDDEAPWDAVRVLRNRNSDEVFELAAAYCRSEIPKHRARALDVLAQLGAGKPLSERPHFNECVSVALAHLGDEDPLVVCSAAWALAHLNDSRAVSALIEMRHDHDADVRRAVACGMANSARPEAISTLIELMEDQNDEVRNWSTFELGQAYVADGSGRLGTLDSTEIRDALRKRLDDSFNGVRAEAIWGLAQRGDREGLRLLLDRLESERCGSGDEMTAAEVLELAFDTPVEDLRTGLRNLLGAG